MKKISILLITGLLLTITSKAQTYGIIQMIEASSAMGTTAADIVPTVPNSYFQDANCFVAEWEYQTRERNEIDSTAQVSDLIPVQIEWRLSQDTLDADGIFIDTVYTGSNPILDFKTYAQDCGEYQPPCNGGHAVQITVTMSNGTQYRNTGVLYAQVNDVPKEYPDCPIDSQDYTGMPIFDFEVFELIKFDPYQFYIGGLTGDFDKNGVVNIIDLIFVASHWGLPIE